MTRFLTTAALATLLALGSAVPSDALVINNAGQTTSIFHFEGMINYHNDVIYTYFSLADDATDVRIWTDSFDDGANFDPITAIWRADDGYLLGENDDNPFVNPGTQTYWDSGMEFASLAAGDYVFTIASYWNFANGDYMSDGFQFDSDNPVDIDQWWNEGTGYWSLWLDGVDSAENPDDDPGDDEPGDAVPELTSLLLFGLALPLVNRLRKRSR